jgi:phage tail P2-like protein
MELLPPNSTPIERAVDAALAARLDALAQRVRRLWNPWTCPPKWLGVLAWSLSVDSWRQEWPEATKRAVIAASPLVHRLKGTVAAVRTAAEAVAGAATVQIIEWFQPGGSGQPFTALIDIDVTNGAPATLPHDVIDAVTGAKPLRTHIDVRLSANPMVGLQVAALIRRPVVHAHIDLIAEIRPRLATGVVVAGLVRRPLIIAHLRGSAT